MTLSVAAIRNASMSTVAEIQEAISRLSPQEYCELMAVLHPCEEDDWDRQMRTDAEGGKFATMNEQAEADYAAGRTTPLDRIIEGEA